MLQYSDSLNIRLPSGLNVRYMAEKKEYFLTRESGDFPIGVPTNRLTVNDAVWLLRITRPITDTDHLYRSIFTNEPILTHFERLAASKGMGLYEFIGTLNYAVLQAHVHECAKTFY